MSLLACEKISPWAMGGSLSEAWERHAADWARWTRVPGHDAYHGQLNWPALRDRCQRRDDGRSMSVAVRAGARALSADRYRVVGSTAPTLLGLARQAGGYEELVCGDAAALP